MATLTLRRTPRDVASLRGDTLTWALHEENQLDIAVINAKLNLILGVLGGAAALAAALFGWLLMHAGG